MNNKYYNVVSDEIIDSILTVEDYSALPDPILNNTKFYRIRQSTGTQWLPWNLGGTYYPKGIYQALGGVWEYVGEFPYQATQGEVNTGVNNDKFVTPLTLAESTYIKDFEWVLDCLDNQTFNTYSAFKPFKVVLVTNAQGSPIVSIQVNNLPYTVGDTINFGDKFDVVVSTASVINLNCREI